MTSCILFLIFSFFNCTFLIFFLYLVKCERSETPSPGKKTGLLISSSLFLALGNYRKGKPWEKRITAFLTVCADADHKERKAVFAT